jgi:dTMP kinase
MQYQALMAREFKRLQSMYGFNIVDGDQSPDEVNAELRKKIEAVLQG